MGRVSEAPLVQALGEAARSLRRMSGLARLLPALAGVMVGAALTTWLVRANLVGGPVAVLLLWLLGSLALAGGIGAARRAIRGLGPRQVAARLEATGAWRRGSLITLLDRAAPGTSESLHRAATDARAGEVRRRGADALAASVATQRRTARLAIGAVAVGAVAMVLAEPLRGATARLWRPVAAWQAMMAPVRLAVRDSVVARGTGATFVLEAVGQRSATLVSRRPGEPWQRDTVALDDTGRAVVTTAPFGASLVARLEAGGRRSADVRVTVRLPALLADLTLTAEYPGYLGLASEQLTLAGDTLVLPAGTILRLHGTATTTLATATLAHAAGAIRLKVQGASFAGSVRPGATGRYALQVATQGGGALEGEQPTFTVRVVADSAPRVEVAVPGVDTVAPPSLRLPLLVAASDDHGLAEAALELRRGAAAPLTRLALALPTGTADRALLATVLDLGALGLRSGDTLFYTAIAIDNSPARQRGQSPVYRVRIATEEEQRASRGRQTEATSRSLDSLAARARQLQQQTEDLARERQRSGSTGNAAESDPLALESARKAEAAAQAQEQVIADAARMQQQVEELRRAAEREGLADSALAAQLGEIRQLLDQAISPELRQRLAELRQALAALDASKSRDALQSLASQQQQSRAAIEQARELFKRAALETSLATMADEAKQLAEAQLAVTPKLADRDGAAAAAAELALADRADSLAKALDRTAGKLAQASTREGLQGAAAQARQAEAQMRQAAQSASAGERAAAEGGGRQAEQQLRSLDRQIRGERQQMQAQMRAETVRALDLALAETARLAQRQVGVVELFRRGSIAGPARAEQALLAEAAGRLLDQALAAGATNALVSPRIAASLAAARQAMRGAIDAIATATPNFRGAADFAGDGVDALAVAAFALLRARDQVSGSQSGSGVPELLEQMQQMAGKQGKMARDAAGMMEQGQDGAEQLLQMAMQQRAVAQQLERLRSQGQLPGADALAQEAKELSRKLEAGRLDRETVQRQDRLFRKMLDAGRTLQGEEQDERKERQSSSATPGELRRPGAVDPRLRSGADEIRLPGWEALQRLGPDERRRVLEYFRLLSVGAP